MGYQIVGGNHIYDDAGYYVGSLEDPNVGALQMPRNVNLARGAAPPARLNPAALGQLARGFAARMPAVQLRAPQPQVVQTEPSRVDETPLPITATAVAAGTQATIAVTSQIIFEPRRLIVPDSIAPFFTIDDFRVGNVPLFAGAGSIPSEAFNPQSVNPNIRKITADPGVQVTVQVTNIDAVQHTFRAAVFGAGAQPQGC